jgi:methylated-DNA-protein-cysteine methyltransferase related protein
VSSPFYARIKGHVLLIVTAVPKGRLLTYKAIGDWLDVVPRHVAYILSELDEAEQAQIPWFRVVPDNGAVAANKVNSFGITQRELLLEEGIVLGRNGQILALSDALIDIADLAIDLPRQRRPDNAPSFA